MRFPKLAIGQRFSFNGRTYSKTGPLTATDEATGKSQLIRKSAEVSPLDGSDEERPQVLQSISLEQREAVLAAYRSDLKQDIVKLAGQQTHLRVDELLKLIDADMPED